MLMCIVEFVDETAQVVAEYSRSVSPVAGLPVFSALGNSPEDIAANARTALTIEQLLDHRSKDAGRAESLLSPVLSELTRVHSIAPVPAVSSHSSIELCESRARLFRHYILNLGPWVPYAANAVNGSSTQRIPTNILRERSPKKRCTPRFC